ncbi:MULTISPECIES: formaldehyde-activating enzyme [Streptomyces]|uniref:formaldehyde-activating enzyme n=1 Tax=Streptomyces TaxID=1883 RepID=UPI001424AE7D|nr:formaldehyde-activating enzyme [Streptomyces sp. AgN23]AJZ84132.1 formaldehyde-activating enzyme [Streptomyces sp. AgN23]WTA86238.1 formaldehyde-activating enzyme [Streptomyces antimycoticus]WTB03202.1 formaldehyde-activating enzyme [Streptomyces antimycoticus]
MPSPFAPTALIGESFAGEGANAAHTNVVIGRKGGPVETAWATALATPSAGHVPFVTIVRPSVPVKPLTLFVPKAAAEGELHQRATWGSAQAGLAQGVTDAVRDGLLSAEEADALLIIAAIWVNPAVDDLDVSFRNQRAAAYEAVRAAVTGTPTVADVLAAAEEGPANPFYAPTTEVLTR